MCLSHLVYINTGFLYLVNRNKIKVQIYIIHKIIYRLYTTLAMYSLQEVLGEGTAHAGGVDGADGGSDAGHLSVCKGASPAALW